MLKYGHYLFRLGGANLAPSPGEPFLLRSPSIMHKTCIYDYL
jgi:hypothetical protein